MVMIRDSNRNSIKVFTLLFEHLPPVVIEFCLWKFFYSWSSHPVVDIAEKCNFCIFLWVQLHNGGYHQLLHHRILQLQSEVCRWEQHVPVRLRQNLEELLMLQHRRQLFLQISVLKSACFVHSIFIRYR